MDDQRRGRRARPQRTIRPSQDLRRLRIANPGRIQRILSPTRVQLTINHSPPEGNLNLFVQCVARNASGRQAARGAALTITDHQRQFENSYTEDLANCVRHLVDELGRGPVRWPPDPAIQRGGTGWSATTSVR